MYIMYCILYPIHSIYLKRSANAALIIMNIDILAILLFRPQSNPTLKRPSLCFYFTRPIESAKKTFLYMYVCAESLFVSSLVLSSAICCDPTSLVTGNKGYLLKIALKVVAIPPGRDVRVVVACAIFLATILFWNVLFDAAFVGLAGSKIFHFWYVIAKISIYMYSFLVLTRPPIQVRGYKYLLIILAAVAIGKTIVAIGAVYRSRSLGLISRRTMFLIPFVWAAISTAIVALVAATGSFVGDWRSRSVTILAAALTAPLARFALFPIVLDRVRHR